MDDAKRSAEKAVEFERAGKLDAAIYFYSVSLIEFIFDTIFYFLFISGCRSVNFGIDKKRAGGSGVPTKRRRIHKTSGGIEKFA